VQLLSIFEHEKRNNSLLLNYGIGLPINIHLAIISDIMKKRNKSKNVGPEKN